MSTNNIAAAAASTTVPETAWGLIAGRHDLPVDCFIFDHIDDATDVVSIRAHVDSFIKEHCNIAYYGDDMWGNKLDVVVTGLTLVATDIVGACAYCGVTLTLWHYDRESGTYFLQNAQLRILKWLPYCVGSSCALYARFRVTRPLEYVPTASLVMNCNQVRRSFA